MIYENDRRGIERKWRSFCHGGVQYKRPSKGGQQHMHTQCPGGIWSLVRSLLLKGCSKTDQPAEAQRKKNESNESVRL